MSDTPSAAPLLTVENMNVFYGEYQALWDISFEVPEGAITCMLGSNGSGKSTVLKAIAGVLPVKSGRVSFEGQTITGLPAHKSVRRGLCLVPERRRVFPYMTVWENLRLGAAFVPGARERVRESMEWVFSLFPRLKERQRQMAGSMSGGEQQMLAMGRGLMSRPKMIMLDEPLLGLSPGMVDHIADVMEAINREGVTVLFNEQNVKLALEMSQRACVLESGQLVLCGTGRELLEQDEVRRVYLGV